MAVENALMGNCYVMLSGTAVMDLMNLTVVSQVLLLLLQNLWFLFHRRGLPLPLLTDNVWFVFKLRGKIDRTAVFCMTVVLSDMHSHTQMWAVLKYKC